MKPRQRRISAPLEAVKAILNALPPDELREAEAYARVRRRKVLGGLFVMPSYTDLRVATPAQMLELLRRCVNIVLADQSAFLRDAVARKNEKEPWMDVAHALADTSGLLGRIADTPSNFEEMLSEMSDGGTTGGEGSKARPHAIVQMAALETVREGMIEEVKDVGDGAT